MHVSVEFRDSDPNFGEMWFIYFLFLVDNEMIKLVILYGGISSARVKVGDWEELNTKADTASYISTSLSVSDKKVEPKPISFQDYGHTP
jgi:hypothetical protein